MENLPLSGMKHNIFCPVSGAELSGMEKLFHDDKDTG